MILPATPTQGRVRVEGLGHDPLTVMRFKDLLQEAGFEVGSAGTTSVLRQQNVTGGRANLILALGQRACQDLVPGWPPGNNARDRRGYLWDTPQGIVLSMEHPSRASRRVDPSGITRLFMLRDLQRAREQSLRTSVARPVHNVEVCTPSSAYKAAQAIREAGLVAADIECVGPDITQCIGFATSTTQAYVFPPNTFKHAFAILRDPSVGKVWQNGQFDLYHLLTREGVRVEGEFHDCIVAWHCMWPEIAGKNQDGRNKSKRTAKSLAFFASVYTNTRWWKTYEFNDSAKMFELNGKDCCLTLDIFQQMREDMREMGVEEIYEHERRLPRVCVDMQARGLCVDAGAREQAMEELQERLDEKQARLKEIAEPLLMERRERIEAQHLFWVTKKCKCCRGASKKLHACWSCAGFEKAPSKKMLLEHALRVYATPHGQTITVEELQRMKKAELEEYCLSTCTTCEGAGEAEHFLGFNPASPTHAKELLYNVLKLPRRYKEGNLTTDEKALKSLLGGL